MHHSVSSRTVVCIMRHHNKYKNYKGYNENLDYLFTFDLIDEQQEIDERTGATTSNIIKRIIFVSDKEFKPNHRIKCERLSPTNLVVSGIIEKKPLHAKKRHTTFRYTVSLR